MSAAKPFLVLMAEDLVRLMPEMVARSGNYDSIFSRMAGLEGHGVVAVDLLDTAVPLPDPAGFTGIIVTGSAAMVTERAPWMLRAEAWLRTLPESGVPALGVCFGHQLIASALGGAVDWGDFHAYETVSVRRTAAGASDALISVLPEETRLQSAHSQVVRRLPAGSEELATSRAGTYAARFADRVWGVQFHPEYDETDMVMIIEDVRDVLEAAGIDADARISGLGPTPDGPALLRRFRDIALTTG